ncbi:MAG: hypothetical protein V8R80_05130 [Eubacterium sp.]
MKVFWFGHAEDAAELKQEFRKFSQDFFLQAYEIQKIPSGELLPGKIIVDGEGIQENEEEIQILDWLEKRFRLLMLPNIRWSIVRRMTISW